jgi:hypothetical protein
MLRRIAVIMAAAILSCAALAARAPDRGENTPAGRSDTQVVPPVPAPPVRAAPVPAVPQSCTAPRVASDRVAQDRVASALKDSIRALGLQTELATDNRNDDKDDAPRPVQVRPITLPSEALWVALIIAVAVLLFSLREELMNLFRRAETGWEPPPPGAGEAKVGSETDALAAADRLSREGNFVEAMHVLLLHSLAEIRRQLGEKFADSLTSREILRAARLTGAARTALREIVAMVERTYFGAYPAEAGDYAACRQNFATLQQVLRGGAPA